MKRRMFSILMVLVLLFSLVPAQALAADTGATLTLRKGNNNSTVRSAWVVVDDTAYQTNSSSVIVDGNGTPVQFAPGTYTVYYATQGGESVYSGSVTVADGDTAKTVTLASVRYNRASYADQLRFAKSVYYNASTFDHLDVRVAGSYVMQIGGAAYTATVSNPSAVVKVNGAQKYSATWTSTESYEWRKTRISLSRSALIEVVLTLDLTYTGSDGKEITLEDVVVTYDNVNDLNKFIEAIAICDQVQGLDFTVSVEDIQEVVEDYVVTYQWMVYNEDGTYTELPEGAPVPPVDSQVYGAGDSHTIDTQYAPGTSFADYEAGLLYTFYGWDTYSNSPEFNINPQAQGYDDTESGNITISGDTWVNGFWAVSQLAVADAYFELAKVIQVDNDGDGVADATTITGEEAIQFQLDTAGYDGNSDGTAMARVAYNQIKAAGGKVKIGIYDADQYGKNFVITESGADIPGYQRKTTVSLTGATHTYEDGTEETTAALTWADGAPEKATLVLSSVYGETEVNLGTLTYINTYTKLLGDAVSNYPSMSLWKSASDTNAALSGAEFTLYDNAGEAVKTYTTGENGSATVDFTGMAAGTYTLKETKAPADYKLNSTVTTIQLTAGTPVEQLIGGKFVQVTTYTATATAPEDSGVSAAGGRIHYYDDPVLGTVAISKAFTGLADTDNVSATVVFHGPITRDAAGAITGLGQNWNVTLNKDNSFRYTLENLPLGEYLVRETMATIHGYTWDGGSYEELPKTETYNGLEHRLMTVTAENADSLTLSITNGYQEWTAADFYVYKVDPAGAALSGAEFTLYSDAAMTAVVATETTDAIGYAHFTGFDADAAYYLKETKAPAGYYLNDTVYKVEVKAVTTNDVTAYETKITVDNGTAWAETSDFNRSSDVLTVTDQPVLGSLTVSKSFLTDGVQGKLPQGLSQIQVQVSGSNNYSNTLTLTAENGWMATLENLPLGTYQVTELDAAVPGYASGDVLYNGAAAASATVTLAEAQAGVTRASVAVQESVTITNQYTIQQRNTEVPASISVKKVDDAGAPLAGATFTLTRQSDGYQISFTTGVDGVVFFDMLSGTIEETTGAITPGKFTLKETKAPTGYVLSDTAWEVDVTENDGVLDVTLNRQTNFFEGIWLWIAGMESDGWDAENLTLTVPNARAVQELTVSKTVEHWLNDEKVANAAVDETAAYSFTLKILTPAGAAYATENFTLKAGASKTFQIPYGYAYTLTENVPADAMYVPAEDTVTGTMGAQDAAVEMINRYFYMEEGGAFFATKIDGETGDVLEGAEFTLYSDEELTSVVSTVAFKQRTLLQLTLPSCGNAREPWH